MKPIALSAAAMSSASFLGLVRAGAFVYAPLPMTSATRFAAIAALPAKASSHAAKTMRNPHRSMPRPEHKPNCPISAQCSSEGEGASGGSAVAE